MSNIKLDVELGGIDDQDAIKSRCHTNRITEDRILTRIEKPIRDTIESGRHRHHEQNHLRYDPTKSVKSGKGNQQATDIEDIVTNYSPDNETKNGDEMQRLQYAEISKTIKKKAREDIRKYHREITRETILAPKSLSKENRQRPYKHRDMESRRRYHLEDTC